VGRVQACDNQDAKHPTPTFCHISCVHACAVPPAGVAVPFQEAGPPEAANAAAGKEHVNKAAVATADASAAAQRTTDNVDGAANGVAAAVVEQEPIAARTADKIVASTSGGEATTDQTTATTSVSAAQVLPTLVADGTATVTADTGTAAAATAAAMAAAVAASNALPAAVASSPAGSKATSASQQPGITESNNEVQGAGLRVSNAGDTAAAAATADSTTLGTATTTTTNDIKVCKVYAQAQESCSRTTC
jgi:hypothetical protein